MILFGLGLMAVMGAPPELLLFSPFYVAWDYLFVYHVRALAARIETVTPADFNRLLVHHGANVAGFAILSVIIARLDWMPAAVVAHVMLVAQAFHNMAFDSRSRDAFMISVGILAAFAQVVLYYAVTQDMPFPLMASLHVVILTLSAFAAMAGLQANGIQTRLEELTARLAAAQKGETVGRLTSGIAHDFRNLLTVMGGNLDLLYEVPPEERPRLLREIRAATERGERLTARLLATARASRSDHGPIDLDGFLGRFVAFAERVIPANVALRLGAIDPGLTLRADAAELEAALLNLVLNARDAMSGGGSIVIDARAAPGEDGTAHALLSVRDDGPGMPPDLIARASEPFVTTKSGDKGTGLGLAMVEAFAAQTGGSIRIESAPGNGTTIQLNLPL
ncbi:MAG: ATP-binding protein [Pseudomonadota bacterium]